MAMDKEKKKRLLVFIGVAALFLAGLFYLLSPSSQAQSNLFVGSTLRDLPANEDMALNMSKPLNANVEADQINMSLPAMDGIPTTTEEDGSVEEATLGSKGEPLSEDAREADAFDIESEIRKQLEDAQREQRQEAALGELQQIRKERDQYKELYEQGVVDRNEIIASSKNGKGQGAVEVGLARSSMPRPTVQVANENVGSYLSVENGIEYVDPSGFHGATSELTEDPGNIIHAIIENQYEVKSGDMIRLRLQDAISIGTVLIPKGHEVIGRVFLSDNRLQVTVSSIAYKNNIMPVGLTMYDTMGQLGIQIQGEDLTQLPKEVAQSLGDGVAHAATTNTSYTINRSAKDAVVGELVRGAVYGVASFARRVKGQPKVFINSGTKVFLVANNG